MPLAYAIGTRVAVLLASGRHLTRADISGLFAEETGALDWGSAWTIDDYNNAVEIGALLWLRESSSIDLTTSVHEAEARFDWLEAALPPRHVRQSTGRSIAVARCSLAPGVSPHRDGYRRSPGRHRQDADCVIARNYRRYPRPDRASRAYHSTSGTRANIRRSLSPPARQVSPPCWQDFDPTHAGPAGATVRCDTSSHIERDGPDLLGLGRRPRAPAAR